MYSQYYQNELEKIRALAREFARAHPAAAPMLSSESVDPDVERLLEGTAFLTGHLQQKIDDDFPKIIHGLMDTLYPHYMRPVPAISIVSFSPKPSLMESVLVPSGTFLAAEKKNEIQCKFKTCYDLEVYPLKIVSAKTTDRGKEFSISIQLSLSGISLSQWKPKKLCFFLSDSYAKASNIFGCFTNYIAGIKIVPKDPESSYLVPEKDFIVPGLHDKNSIFSYPTQSFSGFALLQEFFIFPQRFLFFEISGLEKWHNKGPGANFEIIFQLNEPPFEIPSVSPGTFSLFCVPVVNIFPHEAEPALVDHTKEKIRIRPASKTGTGYQIYSVDKVSGFSQGSVKPVEYAPMDYFSSGVEDKSFYNAVRSISPITNSHEVSLYLVYSSERKNFTRETLSIEISCTNGSEPDHLMPGDICLHTSNSPELLDFKNITPPTSSVDPPLEGVTLWRMLSHITLNILSLTDTKSFKNILQLYVFPESRDKANVSANLKRIQGISDLKIEQEDRLIKGMVARGQKISLSINKDHFASMGDVLIFGSVIDEFFSRYNTINSFTRFMITETLSGESFTWKTRVGKKILE